MIPARVLCNPDFWPSIQKDSEILAKRIAAVQRLAFLRKLLASPYERAA